MRFRTLIVVLILFASIAFPVAAATTQSAISVGTADSDQWYPVVSGDRIAWLDTRGGTGEIYLYDILTGEERRVSAEGAMCESPDLSGDRMVWRVWNDSYGGYDLDIHDLSTGEDTIITSGSVDHANPAIQGSLVVWDDARTGNADIYLYNLSSGQETQITSDPADQINPDVYGDQIAWQDYRQGNWDIYLLNLTTEAVNPIAATGDPEFNPVIDDSLLAWQDSVGGGITEIHAYHIASGAESCVSSDNAPDLSPAVSEQQIVWVNTTTGDSDIWLTDLTSCRQTRITNNSSEQVSPSIDGDRIVWTDYRNGMADIYLGTLQTSFTVPEAAFSADPTIGGSPLTVQFTDESTGDPTTWRWDFGDGETSTEQHPSHTFASGGTYSVALTISNPVGRSRADHPDSIHAGSGPTASFTASPTAGITPLTVRFSDTSTGSPENWTWDFGDGGTSSLQHPSHTYTNWGEYTVTLTAGNLFGEDSAVIASPIEVLNGTTASASTDINGLAMEEGGSAQCAYVDPSAFSSVTFDPAGDPTWLSLVPPPASGWSRITLQARGTGFSDMGNGTLTGTLTDVMLESSPLIPATFSPQTGQNLAITYALNLSRYPVLATVNASIWENITRTDYPRFLQAAYDANYASITAVAYTMNFSTVNVSSVRSATFNLSAKSSWVALYGIQSNMTLLRLGDDGTRQGFRYQSAVTDSVNGLDHYVYESPRGLSRFALASLSGSGNPFQLLVLSASTRSTSGQTGHSSNDLPPSALPAEPQTVQVAEPLFFRETGRPDMTGSGVITRPFSLVSADEGALLSIAEGTQVRQEGDLPLREFSVLPAAGPVEPPGGSNYRYTGMVYNLQPDGVVFDPPVEVQFRVDPAQWESQARYQILSRRAGSDTWEPVPSTQDMASRTVKGSVSHFSLHALFSEPVPVTTPPSGLPTLQAAGEAVPPRQVPRTPLTIISGVVLWVASTARAHILEAVAVLFLIGGIRFTYRRGIPVGLVRPWVFLYLISLSAYLWATFQALTGGSLWISSWVFMVTAGLNLIVHLFRFDRVPLSPGLPGSRVPGRM